MSTSIPNYVSIFCDGSPSWCYTLLHNCNIDCSIEPWGMGGVIRANMGDYASQYQHCPRFPKNVCWNDTRPSMCHHQSFLMDDCTTKQLEIDKKWVFSIFFASLTLQWPWCDLDMTFVLSTSKAQLLLMLLFVHKLRSCWCLHTNLTLQNILIFFTPPPPRNSAVGMQVCPGVQRLKG